MIDPLARGVDPVQLAFQSLVTMGVRTQPTRTESPLAVALQQLGVDLAHPEPFTTAEAKQFVSLVRATVEVLVAALPADQPAPRSGALLETAQVAMRDLQRAVTQVLTDHRYVTTSLAPILRQLLVAMHEPTSLPPGLHTPVPARFFLESFSAPAQADRAVGSDRAVATEAPPTLARLVSSLVESIVRLQAVLPLDAVPRADGLAPPEHMSAPASAERASAPAPLPAATTRLLQTLVEAIADLLTLLPQPAFPGPTAHTSEAQPMETLVRTLGEAIALLHEVLPVTAGHANERSAPIEHSLPVHDADRLPPASARSTPPLTLARLANAVAQVIGLVNELLTSAPRPSTGALAAPPSAETPTPPPSPTASATDSPPRLRSTPTELAPQLTPSFTNLTPRLAPSFADLAPRLAPSLADFTPRLAPGLTDVPVVLAPRLTDLPPLLAASLAEVITHLKAGLPPAVLETVLDESAPLLTGTLLAQLQAAAASTAAPAGGIGAPVNPLEMFDAYRWGLLVALNYRSPVGRQSRARVSAARPRCEMCDRLLEQTRSGALVCPTC
jgi:hypothetical protein